MFARSAAALVGLFNAGVDGGPEVERGRQFVLQFRPGNSRRHTTTGPGHVDSRWRVLGGVGRPGRTPRSIPQRHVGRRNLRPGVRDRNELRNPLEEHLAGERELQQTISIFSATRI